MNFTLLRPALAPPGTLRLITWLGSSFQVPGFNRCRITAAFAKRGGVARLLPFIDRFRQRGGRVSVMVGIDLNGTSLEALTLLLASADEVFVTHQPTSSSTFHPKVYLFDGPAEARAMVGSHNLTTGGLELNYEAGVAMEFAFPVDRVAWDNEFETSWSELLPANHANTALLDPVLLGQLVAAGMVPRERQIQQAARRAAAAGPGPAAGPPPVLPFGGITVRLPSALPATPLAAAPAPPAAAAPRPAAPSNLGVVHLEEVNPHGNAEVFLSITAMRQNPQFFRFPFQGRTVPKKAQNAPYPCWSPPPTVHMVIHDAAGAVIHDETRACHLVHYELKSEIRLTVGQDALGHIPSGSMLRMESATMSALPAGIDFECELHPPGSARHAVLSAACDQVLPGGRRMGWL